jgi:predicted nucleic acid-binding protein
MTSWVVVDSGIYLTSALNEPHAANANDLLATLVASQFQLAAPYLFRYELVSVIRKHVARGTITLADGRTMLQGLLREPVQIFTDELLLQRAFDLATQFGRPAAYDSFYLALAEHLKCEFWTADQKLFNVVSGNLSWVKWIGNFALPQHAGQI